MSFLNKTINTIYIVLTTLCLGLLSAFAFQIKISAAVQYLPWQWTETNYNYYDTYQFSDTDSSNNIYVTNLAEKRVEKYDSNGVFVRNYYADWNSPDSQFHSIKGIAIDSSNNLIVIDNNINKVHIISNAGNLISEFATQGTADNQLSSPNDVAVDAAGNIYIADYGNNFVKKFDSSGNYISKFSVARPIGVAVDSSGNIYVSSELHYVHKYDSAYVLQWSHGGYGSGDTQLAYPQGIDVDSVGNVWIADLGVSRYKKLDTNGNYIYKFGTNGTSNYQFKSTVCISVDSAGNIITIDDNEIKKFSVQSTGYQISNLNAALDIIDRTSKINIESGAPYGATGSAYPLRILTTAGRILSDVNADLTGDLSWPLVVGDSDRATGKSYIANLTAEPGASATHSLYVPIPLGVVSREIYICPDATDMASVNTSCTNGVTRSFGSSSESFGNITITQTGILGDGVTYWKIDGITGSGGIYEELSFSGAGDGSLGNPYQITTCNQLQEIQNDLSSNFILNNDIDCAALDYNGGIFMPIGSSIAPFTGSLNGNNFSISNLEMDKPYDSVTQINNVTGLFGYTNGANIHDLDLINSTIYGNNYVGSLIGYAVASTISNVTASGNIFSNRFNYQNEYIGGLIGYIDGASTIDLASSSVIISFGDDVNLVGGLIGVINGTTIINDSFATGSISLGIDSYWVGGFVGMIGEEMSNADVIINDSYATGNILVGEDAPWDDGNNYWVGGFAGQIGSSENNNVNNTTGTITNCYATGNIEARYADNTWIGGFSGEISGYSVVTNSYSTGSIISGQAANSIGGFTGGIRGINPEIYLSWSSGDITLNSYDAFGVGGFAGWVGVGGYTNDYIIVEDSYSLGDISVGATGYETEWSAMIGGFAGYIKGMITTNPMEISNCFSMGSISAIGEVIEVGGFVGGITGNGTNGTGSVVIDNTASLGNFVEGYYELGGYAGTIDVATAQSLVIKNSYTRSNIVSKFIEIGNLDQAFIAGFVPYVDTTGTSSTNIFNNYSTSSFSQFDSVGATISTALTNPIIITQDTFAVDDPTGITQGTYLIINRPVGVPFATTLSAPMNATQFSADVTDASGLYEYSRITIDPGDPIKEEVVQISTIAGNVLSFSSREGTITHDAGAVVVLDQYSISELVYVEAVNGNNITVRRAEGYTTEWDFPAGTTVNSFQFPLPEVKGFVDTINPGNVLFENNYWDSEINGVSDSAEGIGLTTAQMKDPDSFIGFNFSTYWSTNPLVNDGYPFLSFDDPTIVSFDTTEGLLQPSFHRHTHVYNIDVDTSVDTISFKADATEALIRQIDIDGSPIADNVYTGALTLVDGANQFIYNLTSRDFRTVSYIINVNKVGTPATPTPTMTPTATPTSTPTSTPIITASPTSTPTPTPTNIPGVSLTPAISTVTPTISPSGTIKPTEIIDTNRCLIANSIIKKTYTGKGIDLNFNIDNANSCLVKYGRAGSNYIGQVPAIKNNNNFSASINFQEFSADEDIAYRIECSTGDTQCTLSDTIYRNINPSTVPFLSFNFNLGVYEFITLTSLALGIIPVSIAFPKFWLYAFLWIFPKKKKSPWGIVYDYQSMSPIPFAVVRILDLGGNVLKQTVSDLQGRFSFIMDPGQYQLMVEHKDYNKVNKTILIANQDAQINQDVLMIKVANTNAFWPKLKKNLGVFASKTYLFIGFFGLIFALLAMITNFELVNIIIFGLYIVQLIIYLSIHPDRNIGFVNDLDSKERIKGAFVRVQDVVQGRQIDVQMTDEKGRFGFNLDKGEYLLLTDAEGYEVAGSTLPETILNSGVKAFKYDSVQKNVNFEMKKIRT